MVAEKSPNSRKYTDFSIPHYDILAREDIKLHFSNNTFQPPERYLPEIERNWRKLLDSPYCRILYDGAMVRLKDFRIEKGKPAFKMELTSYKIFCGTNLRKPPLPSKECANGIGICGTIITADNKQIVGLRSTKVFEGGNQLHVVGGNLDPQEHLATDKESHAPDPFTGWQKEIYEEIGVTVPLEEIRYTGTARNRLTHKPEITFTTNIDITSDNLRPASNEHAHLEFFKNSADGIRDFLQQNWDRITPAGKSAITAYMLCNYSAFEGAVKWLDENYGAI
ncbi:MAG: hypothetical protein GF315_03770 [candidate division Zixibacteria bacterium]|nr:hypothetical protein [candidate division Zixibacteria bacterium]